MRATPVDRGARALVAALTVCAAASGCRTLEAPPRAERPPYRFRLGPGDAVRVSVWGRPELLTDTSVAPDGRIALPLAGAVPVAALTLEDAAGRIATLVREFVREPIVTVELREVHSSQIHVVGEVRVPGSVPYHDGITFLEAIQRSGSFVPEFANPTTFLLIRNPLGAKQVYVVDVEDLLTNPSGQRDVFLQPGDVVYVPPRHVTAFARWIRQALAPLEALTGAARNGATAATARPF